MNPICIKHGTSIEITNTFGELCVECLEDAALQSAANMGIPDYYYCGYCGSKCNQEELMEHVTTKKCIIRLVENE